MKQWRRTRERLAARCTTGYLDAHTVAFRHLFPKDARIECLATGFQLAEGPVWVTEEEALLFSDMAANRIFKLTRQRHLLVFRQPSDHANGLTRDRQGRLLACEHGTRRLSRSEHDGTRTVLASHFRGKRLNSPNDVVVKSDGAIYFTDPPYGIRAEQQEQPIQGVYRLSPDGQELTVVAADLARPNGLAFSPDESRLYVDDSQRRHLRVFTVQPDGTLADGRVLCDMNGKGYGAPDGMKVDVEGHIYCAGPGGIWVLSDAGQRLGTLVTPARPTNCAWGDADWQSLYITTWTSVYRVRLNIPGITPPFISGIL
jgi:gluconolactonase